MRYIFLVIVTALFVACTQKNDDKAEHVHQEQDMMKHDAVQDTAKAAGDELIYYTCPMEEHKHVHAGEAGKCPECGMELVAGVITSEEKMEYYGCPMEIHSHVRSDSAGTCAECGMILQPMRLVKK